MENNDDNVLPLMSLCTITAVCKKDTLQEFVLYTFLLSSHWGLHVVLYGHAQIPVKKQSQKADDINITKCFILQLENTSSYLMPFSKILVS